MGRTINRPGRQRWGLSGMIGHVAATKADLRAGIRAARARRNAAGRSEPSTAHRLLGAARAGGLLYLAGSGGEPVVAAYLASAGEPDVAEITRAVHDAGGQVLLPIPRPGRVLDWAVDDGRHVRDPRLPVAIPAGQVVGSGAAGLLARRVRLVLVPALAIDRSGTRLGQGGGYYDGVLVDLDPGIRAVAVVSDEELLPAGTLPREAHDQPVGWVLTPTGVVELGR